MSPICPEIGVESAHGGRVQRPDGTRVPGRACSRSGLVREVPPARWPAGPEEDRPGLDRPWEAAERVRHEASRRGLAAGHAGPGAPRDAPGDGQDRRDVRRRCRRVPALRRARPRPQALDASRLPVGDRRASAARVRLDGRRGRHDRRDRALDRGIRRVATDPQQAADPAARDPRRGRRRSTGCRATPPPRSRSSRRSAAARSRSSRPRRSGPWSGPRSPSRTPRCS